MHCATLGVQGNTILPRNPNQKKPNNSGDLKSLLRSCSHVRHVRELHAKVIRSEKHQNPFVVFELLRLCSADHAAKIFRCVRAPNVFLYTALLDAIVSSGSSSDAVRLYYAMVAGGSVTPDAYAMTSVLKACDLKSGREVHAHGTKLGLCSNRSVKMKLLEMYGKCGEFDHARKVFDETPDRDVVAATVLMSCYFDHGLVEEAIEVFSQLRRKDTVCWTAAIDGLVNNGETNRAMEIFRAMQASKDAKPNEATIVCVLSACAQSGALDLGRWVHSYVENRGLDLNPILGGALINMYSKCGDIEKAQNVFEGMPRRDVTSYNSIIAGLGLHGKSLEAMEIFRSMVGRGVKPNEITFVGILNACSHSGRVELGLEMFRSMVKDHRIEPRIEHRGCMVDLLGRAGRVEEAHDFILDSKTTRPDHVMLGSLLSACKTHGNLELGERVAKKLVELGEADSGTYVMLSNAYASSGRWKESAESRAAMKERNVKKEPGCSSIEVGNEVHEFLLGDIRHPERGEIYEKLAEIDRRLRLESGYSPETGSVLHDVDEAQRERALGMHSERLALAYGLISTQPGTVLRVAKNLRVCSDCHTVIKLISRLYDRRIVVRDRNRFHHFENGVCSCADYW